MGTLMARDKTEAKKKGYLAAGAWAGTALMAIAGFPTFLPVVGVAGASYLTWKWFTYRAKRGMRF